MSYSYEVERRSTPMMVGAVVGAMCIAGVVGFLASSSATSLHTASPVATRVAGRTVAPATMPVARAPAALTAAPYGVEAEVEEAARPVGYAYETPAQTHSWTTVLAGVLAVPLAALGLNSLTKKGTAKAKSRGLLVNIDDLVTVGKQAAVAGAAAAALAGPAAAYPIFAQQGYANPREATGRLVCANCHLAQKETEIELPQAVLPDQVFEAVAKVPTLGADVSKSVDASAFLAPVAAASLTAPAFDPLGLSLGWIGLPDEVNTVINEKAGAFAPLVSFMLFIAINNAFNNFRREQEAKAAAAAGKAITEAAERTVRAVTPEQWGKLAVCVLIDLAGNGSFLLPGLGELSDVVYGPLEGVLLTQLFKSQALGAVGLVEETLPFTDEIPTATVGWVLETFFAESPLGSLFGLQHPEDRKAAAEAAKDAPKAE